MKFFYHNVTYQYVAVLKGMADGMSLVIRFNLEDIFINTRNDGFCSRLNDFGTGNIYADMNLGIGLIKFFYGVFYTYEMIHFLLSFKKAVRSCGRLVFCQLKYSPTFVL